MHRPFRYSPCVVSALALVGALVGCGTDGEDSSAGGPPPSEAVVFQASSETRADLGIAKWGFDTDTDGDMMTYRGYGEKNDVIATVVQKLDRNDPTKYRFALTMTGKGASASEQIEFSARPAANGVDAELVMVVTENTFEEGALPSRVLARFKADSADRDGVTSGSGSLVGQTRPLENGQLVSPCSGTVDRCQNELIDSRIAAAAASGDCGLLKMVGQPLIATIVGAGAGALSTIWGGPTAVVGAVVGGGAGLVGGGAAAVTQCIASRRDATSAANDLRKCQQQQQASCNQTQ